MPVRRALVVCQDNLLKNCAAVNTDFISTGPSITPGSPDAAESFASLVEKILRAFNRLATGRYDLVILPAAKLSWPHDQSRVKKQIRRLIRAVLSLQIKIHLLGLFGKKPRIAFLDRYDSTDIYPEIPTALGADIYFKANFKPNPSANFPFKVQFLPYWVFEENYSSLLEKKTDIFYCASINSDARRRALRELAVLAGQGVSIDHPKERISFPEFVARMGQAVLTLSPSGYGYHGFRHYEAMLMQSVPVLNTNHLRVESDLVDRQTCLLYEDEVEGDLARRMTDALKNRADLIEWGKKLRSFGSQNHSTSSVGSYLMARMEES